MRVYPRRCHDGARCANGAVCCLCACATLTRAGLRRKSVKMLFVGLDGAGKTTLVDALGGCTRDAEPTESPSASCALDALARFVALAAKIERRLRRVHGRARERARVRPWGPKRRALDVARLHGRGRGRRLCRGRRGPLALHRGQIPTERASLFFRSFFLLKGTTVRAAPSWRRGALGRGVFGFRKQVRCRRRGFRGAPPRRSGALVPCVSRFFSASTFESFLFRPNAPDRGVHVLRCETVGVHARYERSLRFFGGPLAILFLGRLQLALGVFVKNMARNGAGKKLGGVFLKRKSRNGRRPYQRHSYCSDDRRRGWFRFAVLAAASSKRGNRRDCARYRNFIRETGNPKPEPEPFPRPDSHLVRGP